MPNYTTKQTLRSFPHFIFIFQIPRTFHWFKVRSWLTLRNTGTRRPKWVFSFFIYTKYRLYIMLNCTKSSRLLWMGIYAMEREKISLYVTVLFSIRSWQGASNLTSNTHIVFTEYYIFDSTCRSACRTSRSKRWADLPGHLPLLKRQ